MSKYRFIKDSNFQRPKNISKEVYTSASYGDVFYYEPFPQEYRVYHFSGSVTGSDEYMIFKSLKNTINYYSGLDNLYNYENLYNKPLTLYAFNSSHLGSGIKKGSVYLNCYISGNVTASCSDFRQDGILYDTNDEKVGAILYREGFIYINNTSSLTNLTSDFTSSYNSFIDNPKWIHSFCISQNQYVFFDIAYECKNDTPTNTFFVYANKYELNHSNNNTFIDKDTYLAVYNQNYYVEDDQIKIKNTIKSPHPNGSANFEKQTFITKIGLYDENKKLIGFGSLANPVRKTENREFLFKLKIDL